MKKIVDSGKISGKNMSISRNIPTFLLSADVIVVIWAGFLHNLVLRGHRFRMKITLGVVLIRSLICAKWVLGSLRSGPVVALN